MASTNSRENGTRRSSSGSAGTTDRVTTVSSANKKRKKSTATVHSSSTAHRTTSQTTAIRNNNYKKRRKTAKRGKGSNDLLRYLLLAVALVLAVAAAVLVIRGISGLLSADKAAEVTTITFADDGTLTLEEVENLSDEGYDAAEAKTYVTQAIDDYNSTASGKVSLVKFKKTDGGAYLKTTYESCDVYNAFTGYSVYWGTVGEYTENEGVFNDIFATVTDGVKGDVASSSDFAASSELKLIIIPENITVRVDGTIKYVSNANTTVTGTDTVQISQTDGNEDQTGQTYIIYE